MKLLKKVLSIMLTSTLIASLCACSNSSSSSSKEKSSDISSSYTAQTAPIVFPVNTAGYSAQVAPTSYSYNGISSYLKAGFIYAAAFLFHYILSSIPTAFKTSSILIIRLASRSLNYFAIINILVAEKYTK